MIDPRALEIVRILVLAAAFYCGARLIAYGILMFDVSLLN
jgi:hypothetical protein